MLWDLYGRLAPLYAGAVTNIAPPGFSVELSFAGATGPRFVAVCSVMFLKPIPCIRQLTFVACSGGLGTALLRSGRSLPVSSHCQTLSLRCQDGVPRHVSSCVSCGAAWRGLCLPGPGRSTLIGPACALHTMRSSPPVSGLRVPCACFLPCGGCRSSCVIMA